jgi:hypothetical protein
MTTTDPLTPSTSGSQNFDDQLGEIRAATSAVFVAGPPVLVAWAGTALLALMLAGPFALLVTFVVALAAAAALVALATAILVAAPYLLVRHVREHWAHHAMSETEPSSGPVRVRVSPSAG